jgi:abhydrolase domain-containing protein 1/3
MYDLVAESPYWAAAATAGLLAWMVYYHKVVVAPPVLHVKRGGRFENFLSQTLPILKEQYWPTFWCVESRLQTVLASFVRATIPDIKYRREVSEC